MDQNQIGEYIKKLRKDNNLTQKELADKLNVTYQAVSKWETGRSIPDISMLKIISEKFDVDIGDILNIKKQDVKINSKRKFIVITLLIILIGIFIFCLYNFRDNFEFKTITTTCNEFEITGSAAYNWDKTFIFISDINYCGKDNNTIYKSISCNLYEKFKDTTTKVASCDSSDIDLTLKEYLENTKISVNNYNAVCKKFKSSELFLEINAVDSSDKVTMYKIPIKLEDNC